MRAQPVGRELATRDADAVHDEQAPLGTRRGRGDPLVVTLGARLGERGAERRGAISERAQPEVAPLAPVDRLARLAQAGSGFTPGLSGGRIDGRLRSASSWAPASARFFAAADTGRSI